MSPWACLECKEDFFYGPGENDSHLYCRCGRFHYSHAVFKCPRLAHGPRFATFDDKTLHDLLENLPDQEAYNVLLVGETGVGKSTFVNAFFNYIQFPTLDAALSDPDPLQFRVPSSFTYCSDEYKQSVVVLGNESSYENYSTAGQAATLKPTIYSLDLDETSIRLIDTPGIGDPLGMKRDKEIVKSILAALQTVERISAILILVQPNASRRTTHFSYCIGELLSYLHRDAAKNILFGYTNSNLTHFRPGNTDVPLRETLKRVSTRINLGPGNQFFFDSGGFRYLAAYKTNNDRLPEKPQYDNMWKKSADEVDRLIQTVMSLPSHEVRKTVELNRAKNMVEQLTKPLAHFATEMNNSQKELETIKSRLEELDGEDKSLVEKVKIKITVPVRRDLPQPKLVCSNTECSQPDEREWDDGSKEMRYGRSCHVGCDIDAPEARIGHEKLGNCRAFCKWYFFFFPANPCNECGHPWQEHLRITYELEPGEKMIEDPEVLQQISNITDFKAKVKAKMELAAAKIDDIKKEEEQVKDARVRFGYYLHQNALGSVYNDSTLAYLKYEINQAKCRQDFSLASDLEMQEVEYQERFQLLEKTIEASDRMESSDSEEGIDIFKIIKELKSMKIYGEELVKVIGDGFVPLEPCRMLAFSLRSKQVDGSESFEREPGRSDRQEPESRFRRLHGWGSRKLKSISGWYHDS